MTSAAEKLYNWTEGREDLAKTRLDLRVCDLIILLSNPPEKMASDIIDEAIRIAKQYEDRDEASTI